jgi:hypothetical protein
LILWLMLKRLGRIWRRQTRFFSLRRRLLWSLDRRFRPMKIHLMRCFFINQPRNPSIFLVRAISYYSALQTRLDMASGEKLSRPSEETHGQDLITFSFQGVS